MHNLSKVLFSAVITICGISIAVLAYKNVQQREMLQLAVEKQTQTELVWEAKYNALIGRQQVQYKELSLTKKENKELEKQLDVLQRAFPKDVTNDWNIVDAEATAYSPLDNVNGIEADSNGNITSIGLQVGPHVFAVDPKRIPYGSEMIIVYPDGTYQTGIAGDTGGWLRSAKGIVVDVYQDTYKEAVEFGRKDILLFWRHKSK
ncbi:MAG: 3D domain-containing protein [Cellulosilyticaceae bacterium]